MKWSEVITKDSNGIAAPIVGAWIEIAWLSNKIEEQEAAPIVGAWIEIQSAIIKRQADNAAPIVGAWIEISSI